MKLNPLVAWPLLLSAAAPLQAADCGREDIDHYLDRGFTPQQVLELCRPEPGATPRRDAALPQDSGYWRDVIDGQAIALTEEALSFTREQCVAYDRPNFAQQRKQACGEVHYSIALQGMQVLDTRNKLLYWGRNSVEVRSPNIERRYELSEGDLSERNRDMLQRELETGDVTEIPIREGVSVDLVSERLRRLAK